jgi:hypothetical protein
VETIPLFLAYYLFWGCGTASLALLKGRSYVEITRQWKFVKNNTANLNAFLLKFNPHWFWTNIVSTLLLLGIRSLNALLAHSIAVNTSYRSSLVLHTRAYKPLVVLDLVIWRKWEKLTFSFYSLVGAVLIQSYRSEYSHNSVLIDWHLDTHKVRLIISRIQINPGFEEN